MKLCDTCIYRNNVEQLKPCIIYRDDCEYYEREEDMKAIIQIDIPNYQIGQEVSIYFKDTMMIKGIVQEPKTGHWIEHPEKETSIPGYLMFYECSECGDKQCFCKLDIHKKRFCSNCGCRMVEPQESEE